MAIKGEAAKHPSYPKPPNNSTCSLRSYCSPMSFFSHLLKAEACWLMLGNQPASSMQGAAITNCVCHGQG